MRKLIKKRVWKIGHERGKDIQLNREEVTQGGDYKERVEDKVGAGERGVRKEINNKQEGKLTALQRRVQMG